MNSFEADVFNKLDIPTTEDNTTTKDQFAKAAFESKEDSNIERLPDGVGEGAHAVHESILIDRMVDRVALLAGLLSDGAPSK